MKEALADVPRAHPAYSVIQHLSKEFALFTGEPDGAFSGRRALTRYEFGISVQRVHTELARYMTDLGKSARTPEWLKNPKQRERALAWHLSLVTEFRPELTLLGSDTDVARQSILRWQDEAQKAAEQAEKK